jgi:hypothetical protein
MVAGWKFQKIERTHRMKKHTLIVTLITAALVGGALAAETPLPAASPGPRCPQSSSDVELYGFYGKKETVIEKVTTLPVNLAERRVFVQITQSGRTDGAQTDVKLFEQEKDDSFRVTEWVKAKSAGLFDEIDAAIVKNKGKACVGEGIKAVLTKRLGPGKPGATIAAPGSPKDAFGPSVQDAFGDFIKSLVIFGC